ncbi:hypothetical protein PYCC9005_002516 [Savitreella phatthalungensis]
MASPTTLGPSSSLMTGAAYATPARARTEDHQHRGLDSVNELIPLISATRTEGRTSSRP